MDERRDVPEAADLPGMFEDLSAETSENDALNALMGFAMWRLEARWQLKNVAKHGKLVDGCRGTWSQDHPAREWCDRFRLQYSFTMNHNALVRPYDAQMLCAEWCRRMEHFWRIWVGGGSRLDWTYSVHHLTSYVEGEEFVAWTNTPRVRDTGNFARRIGDVRQTAPRNP